MTPDAPPPLSYNAAVVLQAVLQGHRYGFEIMKLTGLPSGTVYPLLRRLEKAELVRSRWEDQEGAHEDGRPPRRYYEATSDGEVRLTEALQRLAAQQAAVFGDLAAWGRG